MTEVQNALGHGLVPRRKALDQERRPGLWGALPLTRQAFCKLCPPLSEMHSCLHTEQLARWEQVSV